jgi:hypothetical protein
LDALLAPPLATTVTVISKTNYQLIASHTINPDRNYWRNQQKTPADGRGKLSPMTRLMCNP